MPLKIDKRHGFGMIGIFVAILAVGLLMVAITRLLLSMFQGVGNLNERLEMQSIIQDQWKQMNAGTYEDFEDIVAAKGSPWTQSFGPKYEMKVEFGGKGKYVDAACDSSGSVAETDRQCRKVTIAIVSKALPDVMESLRMTRVSEPDEKDLLKRIEERIAENGNKFNTLYTKAESDARYVRYGMGDFACPWDYKKSTTGVGCEACAAPANDMQYRSGNCQLSTCPAGQMTNEAQNGCEPRLCPQATMLNAAGTACESCTGIPEDSWKQYYGANCSIQTCQTGQQVNEAGTGCEAITCQSGYHLSGDDCVEDRPTCPSDQVLMGDECVTKNLFFHGSNASALFGLPSCIASTNFTGNYSIGLASPWHYPFSGNPKTILYQRSLSLSNFSGYVCTMPYVSRQEDSEDVFDYQDVRYALVAIPKTWSGALSSGSAAPSRYNKAAPFPPITGSGIKIDIKLDSKRKFQQYAYPIRLSYFHYFSDIADNKGVLQSIFGNSIPTMDRSTAIIYNFRLYVSKDNQPMSGGYAGYATNCTLTQNLGNDTSHCHEECGGRSFAAGGGVYLYGFVNGYETSCSNPY